MTETSGQGQQDRLFILGSKGGPAIRPGGPNPTSSLLEMAGRRCVIDCGLGVTRGLVEAGVSLKDLDLIFITHLHSDHVLELGPLLHTAWTTGLDRPVTLYGPRGISEYWYGFLTSLGYDIDLRIDDEGRPDLRPLVRLAEYAEGPIPIEGLDVAALRVDHPPVTECFALKFEAGGWSVVFSADTAYFPPLAGFAAECDILVHEAMLARGVDRIVEITGNGERLRQHLINSHTLAPDAARIALAANTKHLVLNHLIPADLPGFEEADWLEAVRGYPGQVTVAKDGLEIRRT